MEPSIDRARGALLGLAVGDALGTALEFARPAVLVPIEDMVGGGPFGLAPGQWTDDTSMALCLAESLLERGDFDPRDQMTRYLDWYRHGYNSSTGTCFDIGATTRRALEHFERTGQHFAGVSDPDSAGNGSLMRLAPVVIAYARDPETAIRLAGESSRTTHGARVCIDACRYFAGLLIGAIRGEDREILLAPFYAPVPGLWRREPLAPEIAEVAAGSFRGRAPPRIRGTGYVVSTLEAALWALAETDTFAQGALKAVNLGEDADTTGAVFGQIGGALYAEQGIPARWRRRITRGDEIAELATRLFAHR